MRDGRDGASRRDRAEREVGVVGLIRRFKKRVFCPIGLHIGYLDVDHEEERHFFKCTRCGDELDYLGPEYNHGGGPYRVFGREE